MCLSTSCTAPAVHLADLWEIQKNQITSLPFSFSYTFFFILVFCMSQMCCLRLHLSIVLAKWPWDINSCVYHLFSSNFSFPWDLSSLTDHFHVFPFCPQIRNGPICPLSPWNWRTSSILPRLRGFPPRRASNSSTSHQPSLLRNLQTRYVFSRVPENPCIMGNPSLSHLFFLFVCLFVKQLFSCLMDCASRTLLCHCVCVDRPAGSHSSPLQAVAGWVTAGV